MYRVHYLRQPWSQPFEMDTGSGFITIPEVGEVLDCGTAENIEDYLEGVLPGTYVFSPLSQNPSAPGIITDRSFTVRVGHPDDPDAADLAALIPTKRQVQSLYIEKGDQYRDENGSGWNALAAAGQGIPAILKENVGSNEIAVRVQHVPDGGIDFRVFGRDTLLTVNRP